jgi:signal transduction protein with GAF and PtsI domain
VLAADSKAGDAFGLETVSALGRFASLITLLLGSYNQKFDLAADARMLGVLDGMQRGIEENLDAYGIASVAARAVTEIMDWDYVAVVLHSPEKNAWMVVKSLAKAANLPYISEGVTVSMDGSVLRAALEGDGGVIVDAPVTPAWRFHEKEAINSFGQLCAMPLVTAQAYYGLIVVEYRETHQYARQDLAVLRRIATTGGAVARGRATLRTHPQASDRGRGDADRQPHPAAAPAARGAGPTGGHGRKRGVFHRRARQSRRNDRQARRRKSSVCSPASARRCAST